MADTPIILSMLKRVFYLALAYFVFGKLGLLLATPPGYAAALWPSSGIALAGLLLGGYRLWPGVLIGSFSVNIGAASHRAERRHRPPRRQRP